MNVYILDQSRDLIGIIDTYQSFIWTERYYEAGDCELYIPATSDNADLMQAGNYIAVRPDSMLCRITSVQTKTDVNNGRWLIVKGKDARSILNQRVYTQRSYVAVYAKTTIRDIIENNAISSGISARNIPDLQVDVDIPNTDPYWTTDTMFYCFDKIVEICRQFGYGSRLPWDPDGGFVFQLYLGTDRSASQSTNPRLIFSEAMDNLTASDYTEDYNNFKNAAYILGEGQGYNRRQVSVGSASGLNRYEMYVDGSSISQQPNSEEEPLTPMEYADVLAEAARDELTKHNVAISFSGTIADKLYSYGVDYGLGDIVTITSPFGVSYDVRITQVIESDDTQNGHIYIPSFEYIRPTS